MLIAKELVLLYWVVYRKWFPMVASDLLFYTSISSDLLSVFDCPVMYPCFLSIYALDLQNAWMPYFTVHLVHLCDNALSSYLNLYMHTLAHVCTIIAPCYGILFLIRTQGLINHPWFLVPLAYTDLCYLLYLCNNWDLCITSCIVFHPMYVYVNKELEFDGMNMTVIIYCCQCLNVLYGGNNISFVNY